MPFDFTIWDIAFVAVTALVPTWLILSFGRLRNILKNTPVEFMFKARDLEEVLQRCYGFFPNEIIRFQGKTFTRGMMVRITTDKNKHFEGKLIGLNQEDMICILTNRYVIAHELGKLTDMEEI